MNYILYVITKSDKLMKFGADTLEELDELSIRLTEKGDVVLTISCELGKKGKVNFAGYWVSC